MVHLLEKIVAERLERKRMQKSVKRLEEVVRKATKTHKYSTIVALGTN